MKTYTNRYTLRKIYNLYHMLNRWRKIAFGKSYYHQAQVIGKQFRPGRIEGYFNDMTGKVSWQGITDANGIPMNEGTGTAPMYFPSTVMQKALGHWDMWLHSDRRDPQHLSEFLNLAEWAVSWQDARGGWEVWPAMGLRYASPYSGMIQGEGISVLLRAHQVTADPKYMQAALQAAELLVTEVADEGTCRGTLEGLILEEVPLNQPNTVLNGWVFALFGLYELTLVNSNEKMQHAMNESVRALVTYLDRFQGGYWSYYDTKCNLASPFYHKLHIEQLKALELTFPQHRSRFEAARLAMEMQMKSYLKFCTAVMLKAYQKLKNPPEVLVK